MNPFVAESSTAIGGTPKAASQPPWAPAEGPFADLIAKETQKSDFKTAADKDASKSAAQ